MMRFIRAYLLLCLFTVACACAQEGWHPPREQDNKQATLDQTISFLRDAIQQAYQFDTGCSERDSVNCRGLKTFENAHSDGRCGFEYTSRYLYTSDWFVHIYRTTIRFSFADIDPDSITVKFVPVHFDGGDKYSAAYEVSVMAPGERRFAPAHVVDAMAEAGLPAEECARKDKNCTEHESNFSRIHFTALNEDMARRIARAVLHAALSCQQ